MTNSPFKIMVGQSEIGDASKVKVYGQGLVEGHTFEVAEFIVDTRNAGNNAKVPIMTMLTIIFMKMIMLTIMTMLTINIVCMVSYLEKKKTNSQEKQIISSAHFVTPCTVDIFPGC